MKRLLAIVGVFALLGTLFVLATSTSPASAQSTSSITLYNNGTAGPYTATGVTNCDSQTVTVPARASAAAPDGKAVMTLRVDCGAASVTYADAAGKCLMFDGSSAHSSNGAVFNPASFTTSVDAGSCLGVDGTLTVEKRGALPLVDSGAVALSTYTMSVSAFVGGGTYPQAVADMCLAAPIVYEQKGGPAGDTVHKLPQSVIYKNVIYRCAYTTAEVIAPAGQTCVGGASTLWALGPNVVLGAAAAPALCANVAQNIPWSNTTAANTTSTHNNSIDPVPLTVTKTFTGRDYYTTVDRGDFHIYTPGLCGTLPMDPFGGLLGNFGIYRTINASQQSQIVFVTPFTVVAGPLGPCTYRVQENNAPEGCKAVAPDGSDADGPYWDQTWAPGKTAFVFAIVNDCSDPEPEKKDPPKTHPGGAGAKKPSGGGSAAPKFTG